MQHENCRTLQRNTCFCFVYLLFVFLFFVFSFVLFFSELCVKHLPTHHCLSGLHSIFPPSLPLFFSLSHLPFSSLLPSLTPPLFSFLSLSFPSFFPFCMPIQLSLSFPIAIKCPFCFWQSPTCTSLSTLDDVIHGRMGFRVNQSRQSILSHS